MNQTSEVHLPCVPVSLCSLISISMHKNNTQKKSKGTSLHFLPNLVNQPQMPKFCSISWYLLYSLPLSDISNLVMGILIWRQATMDCRAWRSSMIDQWGMFYNRCRTNRLNDACTIMCQHAPMVKRTVWKLIQHHFRSLLIYGLFWKQLQLSSGGILMGMQEDHPWFTIS